MDDVLGEGGARLLIQLAPILTSLDSHTSDMRLVASKPPHTHRDVSLDEGDSVDTTRTTPLVALGQPRAPSA